MSGYICQNAVLLISFNRLDTTQEVLKQIALVKPKRIYLASDGARDKVDSIESNIVGGGGRTTSRFRI